MRQMRHERMRKHLVGTTERPRLSVFRSLKHLSAQIIDDSTGRTLAAASTLEKDLNAGPNKGGAKTVGSKLAERAKAQGVSKVVFDRAGYRYHGCVASLAEAAREGGLEF
ncbi:MAG: large subunit ribosomal protein [Fimbriimonadaceae bacterium]|jgi:large subunit ribosomal protein L18|nr:large subunit ribosomal protein [Fimbriimonadaceae bacterium]